MDHKQTMAHVVKWRPGMMPKRLRCFRCERDLPEDQFSPLSDGHKGRMVRDQRTNYFVQYLHPYCFMCRKQQYGKHVNHPHYSPEVDRYWSKRASVIHSGARKRGLLCLITKEDMLEKYLSQNGLCAISGAKMTCVIETSGRFGLQASVDRIDSGGNYAVNNIQIVCTVINVMKGEMHQSELIKWCARILENQANKEKSLADALGLDLNPL